MKKKKLKCSDVVPGCHYEETGDTEVELLAKAKAHAAQMHGLPDIPPMIMERVRAAIRDVEV